MVTTTATLSPRASTRAAVGPAVQTDAEIELKFNQPPNVIPENWAPDMTLVPPRRSHGRPGLEPARVPARPDLEWFRENLVRGMIAKNMTASDVARALWGEKRNTQGNVVAKGRDRMTGYLSGAVYPSEQNIVRLCEVLNLTPEQLAIDTRRSGQPRPGLAQPTRAAPGGNNHGARVRTGVATSFDDETGPGILVFEIIRPGVVRFRFDQVLNEATAFQLLDEVRRITAGAARPKPVETTPEADPDKSDA